MSEPDHPQEWGDDRPAEHRSAELDGSRIQQFAAFPRAAYRSRSHAIVAMLVCVVGAVQAGIDLVQHLARGGIGWRLLFYLSIAIAGAFGAVFFFRRAIALHKEATTTRIDSPAHPPDFSTLGDGSQRWKNLEEIE